MNWWYRGKTSAWLSEGQWFEPGWWQFFLLGNSQTSVIIPGWKKGTIPENSGLGTRTLNNFQISWNIPCQGRGISGKITVWEQVHNKNLQKSLENSGL
jgi:hypothetical protein